MKLGNNNPLAKSLSMPSSSVSRMSGDGVCDQFPAGLRVLVVDDDRTCLQILERMLRKCGYEVTKCNRAEIALSLLRKNRNGFDIILSDVHMPDMDGFKLLECIGLEMDLPVIMMSADDSKHVVMKGVTYGACDYLIKPVRLEALRNIWQHMVRKRKHEWKDFEQSKSVEDEEKKAKSSEDADYSSVNEGNLRNSKRKKDEEDEMEERDDTSTLKRPRVVWSIELHQQFVAAVNQLGIDKAVPKKILELMNVPGITRENVASHLQKYRLYLRRLSGVSQHQNGFNNSFFGPPEAIFGSMSSLNGLDLQSLAATGQLPAHSLATFQATGLARSTTKSSISMPFIDQRNLFSFEPSKLRFEEVQQHNSVNSRRRNLLHGIPTSMEPKQLANLHQSAHSFKGVNMPISPHGSQSSSLPVHMAQPQTIAKTGNETNGGEVSRIPSSVVQPVFSNGIPDGVLTRNKIVDSVQGPVFHPDFSVNRNTDFPGNSFPFSNNSGMFNLTSKGIQYGQVNSDIKESRGRAPSCDNFNQFYQPKSQEWELKDVGLTFDTYQHPNTQGRLPITPSVLLEQGSSSGNKNQPITNSVVFSAGEESGHGNARTIGQQFDAFLSDNSLGVKTERPTDSSFQDTLFHEHFDQEDLMSALLKQQEGFGAVETEFGFDGFPLDNLSV